ncbi:MAG: Flp pilus assembly complex ATPase component TadA [Alphaproteobacteria bacterium]|nr:Flp pilus assembly complex ATPase component TadA [Alphaproteobacteria bacterium]
MIRRYGALDAEDLLQETWLRLTPYREAREIRHPQALLMRIATNLAADMSARQFHRTRHASEISQSHGWGCELPAQADEVLAKQLVLGLPEPLRDRIVVGEMRDGAAALETLKSWNTGHPGGLSTIHANSAGDVLRRVEDLLSEVVAQPPRRAIAQAVDRIVHIRRTAEGRRVEAVLGVEGLEADRYLLTPLA